MRRRLIALSSVLGPILCATGAGAADLPPRAAAPVFAPVPVLTWSGLYGGFNLGYAWSEDRARTSVFGPTAAFTGSAIAALGFDRLGFDSGGVTGGGQVGANHQFTPGSGVVVGVETDAQVTDLSRTRRGAAGFPTVVGGVDVANAFQAEARGSLNHLGTVRGRVGYAFDRVLIYGTGGFAYGDTSYRTVVNQSAVFDIPGAPLTFNAVIRRAREGLQTGHAYGGGIEYALPTTSVLNLFRAAAVTLKAEYLHYDLGTRTIVGSAVPVPAAGATPQPITLSRIRTEGDLARIGLNFKFGAY